MPEDRRGYLGGSDIASILGVSAWKTAYELWAEKTAEHAQVSDPGREKLFRRGKKLEPWVMELMEEERGIFISKKNQRYTDPEFQWMSCEVDFEYVSDLGILNNGEIKTVSPFSASDWGEEGTDQIPLAYCLQALWGLMVTKRAETTLGVLIGADDLRVYQVMRDDVLIAEMRKRAYIFWRENVEKKIPPAPQTVGDTNKMLYKVGGFVSPGCPEVWEALRRLKGIKAAIKRLESVKDDQEMVIKGQLVIEAEAMGITDSPKTFIINDASGKKMATLAMQHRSGYTVEPTDFLVLRTS